MLIKSIKPPKEFKVLQQEHLASGFNTELEHVGVIFS